MTGLGTAGLGTAALLPFVVAWNPGNAWITPRYVDVDEVNGTGTTASVTIGTSPSAAAAGTPANSISTALLALANQNVTLAAANGQAAATKSVDGAHLRLRAANAGTGCTGIVNGAGGGTGTGPTTGSCWVTIEGDPADATGRACILRAPASAVGNTRVTKVRVTALSIEAGTNPVMAAADVWLDNFELRGASGQAATTGFAFAQTGAQQYYTNGKWWQHGSGPGPSGSTANPILIRNLSGERTFNAPLVANCARLPT